MSVSTLAGDTICNMAYVRCMQAKLTLKVAGGAECRGRHDDLQLADQVLYGLIAGALTSSPGVHGDWDRAAAPLSEAQELYEEGRRGIGTWDDQAADFEATVDIGAGGARPLGCRIWRPRVRGASASSSAPC